MRFINPIRWSKPNSVGARHRKRGQVRMRMGEKVAEKPK
jgi:hypothetical protein